MLNTISTDDAYVNGHVTFVAPRVAGQVKRVLVDDNYRVKKGQLLVQLDKEPFQVQVEIGQSRRGGGRNGLGGRKGPGTGRWKLWPVPSAGNWNRPWSKLPTTLPRFEPTSRLTRARRPPWFSLRAT